MDSEEGGALERDGVSLASKTALALNGPLPYSLPGFLERELRAR